MLVSVGHTSTVVFMECKDELIIYIYIGCWSTGGERGRMMLVLCQNGHINPSNAEATFLQSTKMQGFFLNI